MKEEYDHLTSKRPRCGWSEKSNTILSGLATRKRNTGCKMMSQAFTYTVLLMPDFNFAYASTATLSWNLPWSMVGTLSNFCPSKRVCKNLSFGFFRWRTLKKFDEVIMWERMSYHTWQFACEGEERSKLSASEQHHAPLAINMTTTGKQTITQR